MAVTATVLVALGLGTAKLSRSDSLLTSPHQAVSSLAAEVATANKEYADKLAALTGLPINTKRALPDIDIAWQDEVGLTVVAGYSTHIVPTPNRLLLINGTAVKGLTTSAIDELLRGPVNSDVTLELLCWPDVVQKIRLKRVLERSPGLYAPAQSTMAADKNYFDRYLAGGADLKLKPDIKDSLHAGVQPFADALSMTPRMQPGIDSENLLAANPNLLKTKLFYFDDTGNPARAAETRDEIEKHLSDITLSDRQECDRYFDMAEHLQRTGHPQLAGAILKEIDARAGQDESFYFLKKRLVDFAQGSKHQPKDLATAEQALRDIEAAYSKSGRQAQLRFEKQKSLSIANYALADAEENAGRNALAITTLQKVLKACDEHLSPLDRRHNEQCYCVCPVSDLHLKLAEVYARGGNFADAKRQTERSLATRAEAFGDNSPMLKKPLNDLAYYCAKLGEANKSADLSKQAKILSEPVEDWPAQKAMAQQKSFQAMGEINAALQTKDYAALTAGMNNLLSRCARLSGIMQEGKEADNLWIFAQRTFESLDDAGKYNEAKDIIARMKVIAADRALPPVSMLSLVTEEAVYGKALGVHPAIAWFTLQDALCFDYPALKQQQIDDQCASHPVFAARPVSVPTNLRSWALAYVFSQDYIRAKSILCRAMHEPESQIFGRRFHLVPKDEAAFDLAIAEIQQDNLEAARKLIDPIMIAYDDFPPDLILKVTQVADAMERRGQLAEAEAILQSAMASPQKLQTPSRRFYPRSFRLEGHTLLTQRLLRILILEHKTKEALAFGLKSDMSGQNSSIVFADLAFDSKDFATASAAYMSVANWETTFDNNYSAPLRIRIATRAAESANRCKGLSDEQRGALMSRSFVALRNADPTLAQSLAKQAMALTAENNPSKTMLLLETDNIKKQIDQAKFKSEQIAQAERAEAEKSDKAYSLLMSVASDEIMDKNYDDAVKHLQQALSAWSEKGDQGPTNQIYRFTRIVLQDPLPSERSQDCQRLLQDVTQKSSHTYGPLTEESATCWFAQADLAALNHDWPGASDAAHKGLFVYEFANYKLLRGSSEIYGPFFQRFYQTAQTLSDRGEVDRAAALLTELIDLQRRKLSKNSQQVAHSLTLKGRLLDNANRYQQAAMAYCQARDILMKYGNDDALVSEYGQDLLKLGRNKEADVFLTKSEENTWRSEFYLFLKEARLCESQRHYEHARLLLEKAINIVHGEYAAEKFQAQNELAVFFERRGDVGRARNIYLHEIVVLNDLDNYQTYSHLREQCLTSLMVLNQQQKNLIEAGKYFDLLRLTLEDGGTVQGAARRKLSYVSEEIILGRKTQAAKDLAEAEAYFKEHPDSNSVVAGMNFVNVADLRKKLAADHK